MVTAIYFQILELTQFVDDKKGYFKSFNNIAEQGMFVVNCWYFHFRLYDVKNYIPHMDHLKNSSIRNDMENEESR